MIASLKKWWHGFRDAESAQAELTNNYNRLVQESWDAYEAQQRERINSFLNFDMSPPAPIHHQLIDSVAAHRITFGKAPSVIKLTRHAAEQLARELPYVFLYANGQLIRQATVCSGFMNPRFDGVPIEVMA